MKGAEVGRGHAWQAKSEVVIFILKQLKRNNIHGFEIKINILQSSLIWHNGRNEWRGTHGCRKSSEMKGYCLGQVSFNIRLNKHDNNEDGE